MSEKISCLRKSIRGTTKFPTSLQIMFLAFDVQAKLLNYQVFMRENGGGGVKLPQAWVVYHAAGPS